MGKHGESTVGNFRSAIGGSPLGVEAETRTLREREEMLEILDQLWTKTPSFTACFRALS